MIGVNQKMLSHLVAFSETLQRELFKLELTEKLGGYLTIMHRGTGAILATILIGEIPVEKMEKYRTLSIEKATRVFNENLSSSAQSRNPEQEKYAGAIAGDKFIYAFSGDSEENDEVHSLMLCIKNESFIPDEFKDDRRHATELDPMNIIRFRLPNGGHHEFEVIASFLAGEVD